MAELALGSSGRDAEDMKGTSKGGRIIFQSPGLETPTNVLVWLRLDLSILLPCPAATGHQHFHERLPLVPGVFIALQQYASLSQQGLYGQAV